MSMTLSYIFERCRCHAFPLLLSVTCISDSEYILSGAAWGVRSRWVWRRSGRSSQASRSRSLAFWIWNRMSVILLSALSFSTFLRTPLLTFWELAPPQYLPKTLITHKKMEWFKLNVVISLQFVSSLSSFSYFDCVFFDLSVGQWETSQTHMYTSTLT